MAHFPMIAALMAACGLSGLTEGCGGNVLRDGAGGSSVSATTSTTPVTTSTCTPPPECGGGQKVGAVIAANQPDPAGIALDQSFVYWANSTQNSNPHTGGGIMESNLGGGLPMELAHDPNEPVDLAVDDVFVYWGSTGGNISRVKKAGGEVEVLYSPDEPDVNNQIYAIALDANYVYGANPFPYPGRLIRISTKTPNEVAVAVAPHPPFNMVADEANLYWANSARVYKNNKNDLKFVALYENEAYDPYDPTVPNIGAIAVDADRVYFTTYWATAACGYQGAILSILKDGGDLKTLATNLPDVCQSILVDGSFLYWTSNSPVPALPSSSIPGSGRVMKMPKAGGEPTTVVCGENLPLGLAVDATFVYWTDFTGGTVKKASK